MEVLKKVSGAPDPVGAYSAAVKASGLVFTAGQIALDPENNELIPGGIEEQTSQVLENLGAVLQAAGASPQSILMTTIFLTDISHGAKVNEIYSRFVSSDAPPARQTVAVKALPLGALVEISVVAMSMT